MGAVFNMFMMVAANLVGFVIGPEGVRYFFGQLLGTSEGTFSSILPFLCSLFGQWLITIDVHQVCGSFSLRAAVCLLVCS